MLGNLPPTTLIALAFGVVMFVLFMFLPALLELRRPRDAGPRKIMEDAFAGESQMEIASMEEAEELKADQAVVKKVSIILSVLPNLEA
jgi:hypothetical protein